MGEVKVTFWEEHYPFWSKGITLDKTDHRYMPKAWKTASKSVQMLLKSKLMMVPIPSCTEFNAKHLSE
ncbi:hypothetical protein A616_12445 [Brevibacillus brevis X23]|nr:hypothetical protein A616_12445 [Brevibacillus brevis X23]